MPKDDMLRLENKFSEIKTKLDNLLKYKYDKLSRFQAESFVRDTDELLMVVDLSIKENEDVVNRHLKEALQSEKIAREAEFQKEHNPYYEAFRSLSLAFQHMFISRGWRNVSFDVHNDQVGRLFDLVSETKDTELEAKKLELERDIRQQFMQNYETAVKDRDRQILALTRQVTALLDRLNKLGLVIPEEQEESGEEGTASDAPSEKPELTRPEQEALKLRSTPKSRARYLLEIHPEWRDEWISGHSGLPAENVAFERQRIKLGEKS